MAYLRFKSLAKPEEIGYLVTGERDYSSFSNRTKPGCDWGFFYHTYGDNLTQHSHGSPIPVDMLADFLASLATYLMEEDTPKDHVEVVERVFPCAFNLPARDLVLHLAAIRPKEGKTLYFEPDTGKVSGSDSKRHDKRWYEVPNWKDFGSPESTYALLYRVPDRDFGDFLAVYHRYEFVRDVVSHETDNYGEKTATTYIGADKRSHLNQAFDALACVVESYRKRDGARSQLDCYRHNTCLPDTAEEQAA